MTSFLEKIKDRRRRKALEKLKEKFAKSDQKLKQKNKLKIQKNKTREPVPDKSAILLGLNYPGSHYTLKGCVNDVKNGAQYLEGLEYQVKTLFDQDISREYNLLEALEELRKSPSKNVFFHYSGHGTQVRDTDGDEEDGYDEVVYSKDGIQISDDQINKVIAKFSKDKSLVLVFDCCHSGSIADLPYIYTKNNGVKTEKVKKNVSSKVLCISGCLDSQTAADVTENRVAFGALSSTLYSLLRKYKEEYKSLTWKQLYIDLIIEMEKKGYRQYPMMSASDPTLFYEKISL